MTRCLIICPDPEIREGLEAGLAATQDVEVVRSLDRYPQSLEAGRLLDLLRPDAVFVPGSPGDAEDLRTCVRRLEQLAPGLALIGAGRHIDSAILLDAMRIGLREFVVAPFEPAHLREILNRRDGGLGPLESGRQRTFCILPGKPGSGASTIALHTARAVSERLGGDTALLKLDYEAGWTTRKTLPDHKPDSDHWSAAKWEEQLWHSLVERQGRLDVITLPRTAAEPGAIEREIRAMVRFAARHYRAVLVDLGGCAEDSELDVIRRSHATFLVAGTELASLRLTHERLGQLNAAGLGTRVELVLNRSGRINPEDVETVLGHPVHFDFVNDYRAVIRAASGHSLQGPLVERFDEFAAMLVGQRFEPKRQSRIERVLRLLPAFQRAAPHTPQQ